MNVMIVDSSPLIVDRLKEMISDLDIETKIVTASTNSEAAHVLNKHTPDIMVLGWDLPGIDAIAIATTTRIKNKEAVIIGLSHFINPREKNRSREYNVNFLFDKYDEFDQVADVIKAVIH